MVDFQTPMDANLLKVLQLKKNVNHMEEGLNCHFGHNLRPSKKINMFLVRVLKIKEEEGLFYFIFFIENGA